MKPVAYLNLESGDPLCPACASTCVGLSASALEVAVSVLDIELERWNIGAISKRGLDQMRGLLEEEYLEALVEIHGPCQRMYSAAEGASEFYEFSTGFTISVQDVFEAAIIDCSICGHDVEDDGAGYTFSRAETVDLIMDIENPQERAAWLLTLSQIEAKETIQ